MVDRTSFQWVGNVELSAAQAIFSIATGQRCVDPGLESSLKHSISSINLRLNNESIDLPVFWNRLRDEVVAGNTLPPAAIDALRAGGCSELHLESLGKSVQGLLGDARHDFLGLFPKLAEQLSLRIGPIRDRWDTCGRGLLRWIGIEIWEQPPDDWWISTTIVNTAQPVRGGDGGTDSKSGKIWIEAVLTDIDPEIPEVLRLTWLITSLAMERYLARGLADQSTARLWRFASVPLVLAAGVELDLIRSPELPIQKALELWRVSELCGPDTLGQWWQTSCGQRQPWPLRMQDLNRLIIAS